MKICFSKPTRKYPLKNRRLLVRVIKKIAEISGLHELLPVKDLEFSVILVDDSAITEINEQYLNHQGPTDVISFDYIADFDEDCFDPSDPYSVGDLYISLETAERQGREYGKTLNDELLLYIAHGILHLCGFDDHEEGDIAEMRAAEKRVLLQLENDMGKIEVV